MLERTDVITYNLKERGRSDDLGLNRNDVDIRSWINAINATHTQELVESGDMYGYYGHEIRQRFGVLPPDTFVNEAGETIRIEPAIRTIKLSADNEGNVTTQYEFMPTDHGAYASQLNKIKAGGFSGVVLRNPVKNRSGFHEVTGFYGSDYVKTPNYNTHRGYAQYDALILDHESMFDSLVQASPNEIMLKRALETAIMSQRDSIAVTMQANGMIELYQNEAMSAQNELIARQQRAEIINQKRARRKDEVLDNLICPSQPFSELMAQYDGFVNQGTGDSDLVTIRAKKEQAEQDAKRKNRRSVFNRGQY